MENDKLVEFFLEMVSIDSETFHEAQIADYISEKAKGYGFATETDRAGEAVGSDTGNLLVRIPGREEVPALLISAHLDTVSPGEKVKAVLKDDKITSEGETILGADCKSGLAIILDIMREIYEERIKCGPLEIVLSVAEEKGLLGIKNFDISRIRSKYALVLDGAGSADKVITAAPTQENLNIFFIGRRAHAGMEPEKGINAIQGAARGISEMRLGRIDEETTANIGLIEGGEAINIVPDRVEARGEVRSLDLKKLQAQKEQIIQAAMQGGKDTGVKVEVEVERAYDGFSLDENSPLVRIVDAAGKILGMQMTRVASGGGSDANILNSKGVESVVLNTGGFNPHSEREYLDIAEFLKAKRLCKEIIGYFSNKGKDLITVG